MREFTPPAITTKARMGAVDLSYAFRMVAQYDPRHIANGKAGGRSYRAITGGRIEGAALNGSVYPDSGGDYGVISADGVEQINARFMLRDDKGEWIYIHHVGCRRPDGYHRVQAFFDADANGPYAWLNDAAMLAHGEEAADGRRTTYTYYQAI